MAKSDYINVSDSTLRLTGDDNPVLPSQRFAHDFSVDGPEGEHGPAREAAMIAAGAITLAPIPSPPPDRVEPAVHEEEHKE